ncbi:hypothetical protein KY290_002478 [Solanum tuberosum]|uniref:DUF4283 domain-containing protein n=1 Tax=Solanum tuberosum TaxID=4113 RepID=A0ABQ7WSC9_SOLTU|nr:hypothetical protein KY289_002660 [Solanum tuberosum]KAH0766525.1 hypothetical protein KY285_002396 [Solanum tuberosum]KAH0782880.1 hypothetical protein KY290_002478 [Solanum tuberosum]
MSPMGNTRNTRGSNNPKFPDPPDPANKNRPPQPEDFPPLRTKPMEIDQTHNHNRKDSYAGALGYRIGNRSKLKIRLPPRAHEIIDGKAVVVFTKEEHEILADTCRWTIIGKFSRGRPAIDRIRSDFTKVITTKGEVKIGAKDRYHVFIDVENEEDFNDIFSRDSIALNDDVDMKILKWTPNFKPNAENSLAPVWINLPDLPWHYYEWDALCRIVDPIGVPLIMDKATTTKTRPTTAKLRVQIDLAKPLIHTVRVEVRNLSGEEETFEQKIEYETLPIYCSHCKVQNHSTENCKVVHTGTNKVREQQSNKEEK